MADDCRSSLAVQVGHRLAIAGGMSHGTYQVHYPVHGVAAAWQQPKKSTPSALAKLFGVTAPSCSVSWVRDDGGTGRTLRMPTSTVSYQSSHATAGYGNERRPFPGPERPCSHFDGQAIHQIHILQDGCTIAE